MTKIALCYVVLLIAAVIFYIAFVDTLSLLLLITAIVFPIVMLISLMLVRKNTQVRFVCEKSGENKNRDVAFKVLLHNKTILPLPRVHIKISYKNCMADETVHADFLVPLHFSKQQEVRFSLSSQFCGKINAYIDEIVFYDYIMLFNLKKKPQISCNTIILPQIHDIAAFISEETDFAGEKEVYSQTRPGDDPSEVFSMRDYLPGDRMSQIHWKLSSKQDDLIVKEYSKPINSNVLLLFDFDALGRENQMQLMDTMAESLISLSDYMINSDCEHYVGLYNSDEDSFERFDIASEEDCVIMARKVLSRPCCSTHKALLSFSSMNFSKKYSHIIYASIGFDAEKAAILESIGYDTKISAIVIDDKSFREISEFESTLKLNFPLYPVECGKIGACLTELVI